jgi:hypothetical protein
MPLTTTPLTIRASNAPLAAACPGSLYPEPGEVLLDSNEPAAQTGSAIHAAMALIASGTALADLDVAALAAKHGAAEARIETGAGILSWMLDRLGSYIHGNRAAEVTLGAVIPGTNLTLSGHADLATWEGNAGSLIDYKTGYRDTDHYDQVAAYIFQAFADPRWPDVEEWTGIVVRLASMSAEPTTWTRAKITAWANEFSARVLNWDGVYHTGDHCRYCRRCATCPAQRAIVRTAAIDFGVADFKGTVEAGLAAMTDAERVTLYRQASILAEVCESVKRRIKDYAIATNTGFDAGGGMRLVCCPTSNRTIDPARGWAIVSEAVGPRIAEVVKIRLGELETIVGKLAGRGGGKRAKEALTAKLDAAGAISRSTSFVMREVRQLPSETSSDVPAPY